MGFARARGIATDAVIRANDVLMLIGDDRLANSPFDIVRLEADLTAETSSDRERRLAATILIARQAHGIDEEPDDAFATMFA